MKKIFLVLLVLSMSLVIHATDYYGAIAMDKKTGRTGYSYDYTTRAGAESRALKECGSTCKVQVWVRNGCAATAYSPKTTKIGWAWGGSNTLNSTGRDAKSYCGESDCTIKANFCTTIETWYYY